MYRVTQDPRYRAAALACWGDIKTWLRNPKGGYYGELPRDFLPGNQQEASYSQNPLMHLFEALLSLHEATNESQAMDGARDLASFIVYRLLVGTPDGGAYLPEWYDAQWKPLPTREKGGYTDLGHQFEWAHLLIEAEHRGLAGIYGQTAERILSYAIKVGYDENDGGVYKVAYPDGSVNREKGYWQQCEALRAFLAASAAGGRPDMGRRFEQTLTLVQEQFIDKVNGGWFPTACKRGGCTDNQVEPYHMTGFHLSALAFAKAQAK